MNEISALKNEGITVKASLDKKQVHRISSIISKSICNTFSKHNLNKEDVFNCLSSINMFIADFAYEDSMAKYFSKNNSIYFNSKMDFENIDTLVIHECLHAIQETKNNRGKLIRLGLYEVTKNIGEGINEASVQLMAAKVSRQKFDYVKYYDMNFGTYSQLFYPIETALINQLSYFTGSYVLYHSTLFSDDIFKNTIIAKIGQKNYNKIVQNFDCLIQYETDLQICTNEMARCNSTSLKYQKLFNTVENCKKNIVNITFETQNLIMLTCFYSEFNLVKDLDSLDIFQKKLINFEKIIITNPTYLDYSNFCENMLDKCIEKSKVIRENGTLNYSTSLQLELISIEKNFYNWNFFKRFFRKLKLLYEAKIYEKD